MQEKEIKQLTGQEIADKLKLLNVPEELYVNIIGIINQSMTLQIQCKSLEAFIEQIAWEEYEKESSHLSPVTWTYSQEQILEVKTKLQLANLELGIELTDQDDLKISLQKKGELKK